MMFTDLGERWYLYPISDGIEETERRDVRVLRRGVFPQLWKDSFPSSPPQADKGSAWKQKNRKAGEYISGPLVCREFAELITEILHAAAAFIDADLVVDARDFALAVAFIPNTLCGAAVNDF